MLFAELNGRKRTNALRRPMGAFKPSPIGILRSSQSESVQNFPFGTPNRELELSRHYICLRIPILFESLPL
jgi:hypothetical protein